ncbi:branched-chain amino acid ABC transporter substrate-binding protein [Methylobacterium nodulans]|uniref:branched-chain amino acid ABC transporter substrate-binding protein n=1 Tax=Methylobacterium nodulans TaxID=114616 RepID=UPI0005C14289|nr:branched-chain amino acid ABC transporter substrate-binding protein [Methylobacterium nodulans]
MRTIARTTAAGLLALAAGTALAAPATLRIAFIDPLSGGGASTGESGLKTFQYMAEQNNAKNPDLKLEVTGYDNKLNSQESLVQLQKAIDSGARIVVQGNGSSVAAAIIDFVSKYNDRNPGKEVIYLNYAAVDPALTNAKCSYWHFRFDANSDIKMAALTSFIKGKPEIKKVYLINQDYSFGQAVRAAARAMLKEKRPDIQIVGDEVAPLQKVNDFSPYIAKIKASGADTVITGNWAQDMALLLKAAGDAGLQANFYTYYGGGTGGPTAIKQANLGDRVFQVAEGFANIPYPPGQDFERAFRARTGQELTYPRVVNLMNVLVKAADAAKSTDPKAIAKAMESIHNDTLYGQDSFMRPDDHQLFQTLYISQLGPVDTSKQFDSENTGWGWKAAGEVSAKDTLLPTTCKMDRPS